MFRKLDNKFSSAPSIVNIPDCFNSTKYITLSSASALIDMLSVTSKVFSSIFSIEVFKLKLPLAATLIH